MVYFPLAVDTSAELSLQIIHCWGWGTPNQTIVLEGLLSSVQLCEGRHLWFSFLSNFVGFYVAFHSLDPRLLSYVRLLYSFLRRYVSCDIVRVVTIASLCRAHLSPL